MNHCAVSHPISAVDFISSYGWTIFWNISRKNFFFGRKNISFYLVWRFTRIFFPFGRFLGHCIKRVRSKRDTNRKSFMCKIFFKNECIWWGISTISWCLFWCDLWLEFRLTYASVKWNCMYYKVVKFSFPPRIVVVSVDFVLLLLVKACRTRSVCIFWSVDLGPGNIFGFASVAIFFFASDHVWKLCSVLCFRT